MVLGTLLAIPPGVVAVCNLVLMVVTLEWVTIEVHSLYKLTSAIATVKGGSPTSAPFMGTSVQQGLITCWFRCACATSPYAHGGQGGMTTYCGGGNCCAKGMTGGPGVVKISFL